MRTLATHISCLGFHFDALTWSCIHIAHCTYAMCWMLFSLSGVLIPSDRTWSEEKIDNANRQILVLKPTSQALVSEASLWFSKLGKHNLLSVHIHFPKCFASSMMHSIQLYFGQQVEFSYILHCLIYPDPLHLAAIGLLCLCHV